jgi:hypothetical protein
MWHLKYLIYIFGLYLITDTALLGRQNILWKNHGCANITIYAIGQTSEMALYFEPLTSCLAAERFLMQHANEAIEM